MKTKKSSLSLILAVLMLFVASMASAALTPNADGVYEIGTEADLKEFRDGINDGTIPADSDAKLIADITLTGNWKPIGLYEFDANDNLLADRSYQGIFDGNCKIISNLRIVAEDTIKDNDTGNANSYAIGFFGVTSTDAIVKNFTISGVDIEGPGATVADSKAGSAVGTNKGTLQGVGVQEIVKISGAGYVGGLAGKSVKTENCFVMQETQSGVLEGYSAGGLTGIATHMKNSYVYNIDTIHATASGLVPQAAGLTGALWGTMENCSVANIREIVAEKGTANYSIAGALVGHMRSSARISNSFASSVGLISGVLRAGGLVGVTDTSVFDAGIHTITNSALLLGNVSTQISGDLAGTVGGVVGWLNCGKPSRLSNCVYPSDLDFVNGNENKPIGNLTAAAVSSDMATTYNATLSEEELPVIAVTLDSYTLTLAVGESRTFDASTLPGKAGDFACEWGVDDASIASVAGEGLSVTVTGVAVGSSTVTAKIRGDINVDLSCIVNVVEETEETDPTVTGKPSEDGTIFPGEDVELVYDFSPYIAIAVDNSGMQTPISGLLADILDGKVVVMGVSKEAGTYFYVVTLQRPDGSTFTQKVYVTIQGGSRPTGDTKSGGGSSNCNTGVGAALFALLGLAFIQKRK